MRITYLCLQPTREGQASYAHVFGLVNALRRRNHEVVLHIPNLSRTHSVVERALRLTWPLTKSLKSIPKSDCAYLRLHIFTFPGLFWARLRKVPVVLEVNGSYADWFIAWPLLRHVRRAVIWVIRSQLRTADGVIAVTRDLVEWVEEERRRPGIFLVPNAADSAVFSPPAGTEARSPFVLFFGAFTKWHNIPVILSAVDADAWPESCELHMAGEGDFLSSVLRHAERPDGRVRYLGVLKHEDVPVVARRALASICIPGKSEGRASAGSPIKMYESLACGTPVIVSDFEGQSDFVRAHGCGMVVENTTADEVAEAVAFLYRNPSVAAAMGRKGSAAVLSRHTWGARAEETEAIIAGLLSKS